MIELSATVGRAAWASTVLCVAVIAAAAGQAPVAASPMETHGCDFNADGDDDQAIGAPGESVEQVQDAGSVHVLYGSPAGLGTTGNQLWHEDIAGVRGVAEPGDRFGEAVTCGDFNGDGFDDLAVGAPGQDDGRSRGSGSVHVLRGSSSGLVSAGNQLWTQNSPGIDGVAESGDRFGTALTAGDFDGDGRDDLAVGAPTEKIGSADVAGHEGVVSVIYGTSLGLRGTGSQLWSQASAGIAGVAQKRDLFGTALASGDFNGDGRDDLAVGVPGEDVGSGKGDAGAVNVIYGAAAGLRPAGNTVFTQDSAGILGVAQARDFFGVSLAVGDFDGNGRDDLAIGAPGEDLEDLESTGAVHVLYGGNIGLSSVSDDLWHQGVSGIAGDVEAHDRFGDALAAADFDGNGRDDLAIGAGWETIGGVSEAGTVTVLYAAGTGGLSAAHTQLWHQNVSNVPGDNEAFDRFGETLSTGDFNGDGFGDLAVGVPGERFAGVSDAGGVNLLYAFPNGAGLSSARSQFWAQDSAGILGNGERFDRLSGRARSAGVYRIAYADGTEVSVSSDRMLHSAPDRIDMSGVNGSPYTIVAARAGTVRAVVDTNAEPTSDNNYVWIEHDFGEWTKYSHFVTGSVTVNIGDVVSAGTPLGIEGDVGVASGEHLHFEVAVPYDSSNPTDARGYIVGYNLDPVICGIPGQTYVAGQTYTADDC